MAKRKDGFYIQLSRNIFKDEYKSLSINAKWLYTFLNELEHRYTNSNDGWFFRSNELLAEDTGMSLPTLKRAKKELLETGLVEHFLAHFEDPETKKKSKKKISAYRIL